MKVFGVFDVDHTYGKETLKGLRSTRKKAETLKEELSKQTRPNGWGGTQPAYDYLDIQEWEVQ